MNKALTSVDFSFNTVAGQIYEVSLVKLTEASLGTMSFGEVTSANGELIPFGVTETCN